MQGEKINMMHENSTHGKTKPSINTLPESTLSLSPFGIKRQKET
jgi:hypothetical protein